MSSTAAVARTPGGGSFAGRAPNNARNAQTNPAGKPAEAPSAEGDENAAPGDGNPQQQPANGKKARVAKKREKLTWEMMIGDRGIPYVYREVPDAFRRQFKGRGHEAGDLGRLLSLYDSWQKHLYPNADGADAFLADVERFSNQGTTKVHLREMRDGVLELSGVNRVLQQPAPADAEGQDDRGGEPAGAALDEEELMELQAMGAAEAQEDGPEATEPQALGDDGLGMPADEEVMEDLREAHPAAAGGLDDDEMEALEDEMFM